MKDSSSCQSYAMVFFMKNLSSWNKFHKHVLGFLNSFLNSKDWKKNVVVAVSGGRDSMLLLSLANSFYREGKLPGLRVIGVDHLSRENQENELEMVYGFCKRLNLSFEKVSVKKKLKDISNFEAMARQYRYDELLKNLKKNEVLWLGHHLDDSFEWSLMQRFRSSEIESSLGIPVRNGKIIRPFLCVTRTQINFQIKNLDLPYVNDPSNQNPRFLRNNLRLKLIKQIKNIFPGYLAHYAYQSQKMAQALGVSIYPTSKFQIYSYEKFSVMLGKKKWHQEDILDVLKKHSATNRGKWSRTLSKVLKAIENGKIGPFQVSGGVSIYNLDSLLVVGTNGFWDEYFNLRLNRKNLFVDLSFDQLEDRWFKLFNDQTSISLWGLIKETQSLPRGVKKKSDFQNINDLEIYLKKNKLCMINLYSLKRLWPKDKYFMNKKIKISFF